MKTVSCFVLILGTAWGGHLIGGDLQIYPAVELEFATVLGGVYQIQASSNMVEWSNWGDPIAGDGAAVNRLYSIQGSPYRFFRVIPDLPPSGTLTNVSDCKTAGAHPPLAGHVPSASEECLYYDWNGQGTLALKHVNAGFNCCPDRLISEVTIADQTITLTETEIGGLCDCDCLTGLQRGSPLQARNRIGPLGGSSPVAPAHVEAA